MSENSPISENDATNNFLISFRDEPEPRLHPGKPGTRIGATTYIVTNPSATTYNLKSDMVPMDTWLNRVSASKKVVVFVHGFADDADKVLARHNSIKQNLPPDEEFTLVSFDWPAGNYPDHPKDGYWTDKENATAISWELLPFLQRLQLKGLSYTNMHLLAHSMGAFLTETAFQAKNSIKVNHVFMAAADVDREHYISGTDFFTTFLSHCTDLTVYWGMQDQALQESAEMNVYTPLGLTGYRDWDLPPKKQSVQCTDYYYQYVEAGKPDDMLESVWSHVWYLIFLPAHPPPLANDCFADIIEILRGQPTTPTRTNLLRSTGAWPTASEPLTASEPPTPATVD